MKPTHIDVNPETLTIRWADGHESIYPMRYLRQHCRCANCVHEITGDELLVKNNVSEDIRCLKAEPVGHYALTFSFSDQHATGIYAYDYLRAICPCEVCGYSKSH